MPAAPTDPRVTDAVPRPTDPGRILRTLTRACDHGMLCVHAPPRDLVKKLPPPHARNAVRELGTPRGAFGPLRTSRDRGSGLPRLTPPRADARNSRLLAHGRMRAHRWAHSSAVQSGRLITGETLVRIQVGP